MTYSTKSLIPAILFSLDKETLEYSHWHDPDLAKSVEWYSEMLLPDKSYLQQEDSYRGEVWNGILSFRTNSFRSIDYLPHYQGNFSNIGGYGKWMENSCDIAAALAEGALDDAPTIYRNECVALNSGDILLRPKIALQSTFSGSTVFFHLNAEKNNNATNFYGFDPFERGHEHRDAMSFSLYYNGAYQAFDPGFYDDGNSWNGTTENHPYRFADAHNTWTIEKPLGSRETEGPKDGDVEILTTDFDKPDRRIIIEGYLYNYGTKIYFTRTVQLYPSGIVDGEATGYAFKITDRFNDSNLGGNVFTYHLNGNGWPDASTTDIDFKELDSIVDDKNKQIRGRLYWKNCSNSTGGQMTALYKVTVKKRLWPFNEQTKIVKSIVDAQNATGGTGETYSHKRLEIRIEHARRIEVETVLHINSCNFTLDSLLPKLPVIGKGNGTILSEGNSTQFIWTNDSTNEIMFDSILLLGNDSLKSDAKSGYFNFDNSFGGYCEINSPLRNYSLDRVKYFAINDTTYFSSNNQIDRLFFNYKKLYNYTGSFETSNTNDTITFYLPEAPPTNLSLMTEQTGLNYSYDTTTQKITLYLPDSGSYNFSFGPSNPCAVSCFYPPDSIYYHFEHQGTAERLGHILDIKADTGWLDMRNGAKMQICAQAVCRNHDSLSLSSDYACKGNSTGNNGSGTTTTKGYTSHYLGTENEAIRTKYRFGSGAGLATNGLTEMGLESPAPYTEVRTMIVVENGGALVLKSGSHTVVGNGSTILVKPGGTLKIEDGAYLTIGSHDSIGCGFGEIIIMDSAFLCVGADAHIAFYNKAINSYDSIDVHIFYISQNPKNPAINSVAPTSNAETSGVCLPFCDLKTAFPEFGIDNYKYGWLNVATPQANLQTASMVCDGERVYANGLYSLNETRYRFEVCKYNTGTSTCIGAADTIPLNDTDNYFGGRLQGSICLSDYYIFERGHNYKIRFTIKNDCGDSDYVDKIIEIPALLQAQIIGDTVICGGTGAMTVSGTSSFGSFDSLRWEVWAYKAYPVFDSATYFANADTFVSFRDTFWLDSVTIDTILVDTFWFYKTDTIDNDSLRYAKYYRQFWDTTIVSPHAEDFTFDELFFYSGRKYRVLLTLYNQCTISTDSLMIRIKDGPTVSAGNDKYIPYGSPTVPNPILNGSVGSTVSSYIWSPSTGLSSTTVLSPTATPSTSTTYILAATDADGCTNYDSVLVWVNTIAHAGKDTVICHDDSIQVGNTAVSGYSYQWSPSILVSNANIAQPYAYSVYGGSLLQLQVFNGSNELVGVDDIFIERDTTDLVLFSINPGAGPFNAGFNISYTPISATSLTWNFGDGAGNSSGKPSMFNYQFPFVPNGTYNVCVSYVNACGTQQTCKTAEFDMLGTVIPKPDPVGLTETAKEDYISVWPNPFINQTTLAFSIEKNEGSKIEITDLAGRVIKTIPVLGTNGKVQIDLHNQADGVYQYRFINADIIIKSGKLVLIK